MDGGCAHRAHQCIGKRRLGEVMIMKDLKAGIKGNAEVLVTEANSAAVMGSGTLPVFATGKADNVTLKKQVLEQLAENK